MEIALWVFLMIIIYCLIYICNLRKDIKCFKSRNKEVKQKIINISNVLDENSAKYTKLQNDIETELNEIKNKVNLFKLKRDPDSSFPSVERSIEEANVIANFRMLQRLYKKLI